MKGCGTGFLAFAASENVLQQYHHKFRTLIQSYSELFAGISIKYSSIKLGSEAVSDYV
jgi:hypothetical protein